MSINCMHCGSSQTQYVDSRKDTAGELMTVRRRIECRVCCKRFSTYEMPVQKARTFERDFNLMNEIGALNARQQDVVLSVIREFLNV